MCTEKRLILLSHDLRSFTTCKVVVCMVVTWHNFTQFFSYLKMILHIKSQYSIKNDLFTNFWVILLKSTGNGIEIFFFLFFFDEDQKEKHISETCYVL